MESGPTLWLIVLAGGIIALGLAMAYAMSRNRTRTPLEKVQTDIATKQQYEAEDKDHS